MDDELEKCSGNVVVAYKNVRKEDLGTIQVTKFTYFLIFVLMALCFGTLYIFFVMVLFAYDDAKEEDFLFYGAFAPYILGQELRKLKDGQ